MLITQCFQNSALICSFAVGYGSTTGNSFADSRNISTPVSIFFSSSFSFFSPSFFLGESVAAGLASASASAARFTKTSSKEVAATPDEVM